MAITYAKFRSGYPIKYPYTPGSAVSPGDVVVAGPSPPVCRVAHLDIAANELGELSHAFGIYSMPKSTSEGMTAGDYVFWNESTNQVTRTSADDRPSFGIVCGTVAAAAERVDVLHWPSALATDLEEQSSSSSSTNSSSSSSSSHSSSASSTSTSSTSSASSPSSSVSSASSTSSASSSLSSTSSASSTSSESSSTSSSSYSSASESSASESSASGI